MPSLLMIVVGVGVITPPVGNVLFIGARVVPALSMWLPTTLGLI